MRAPCWWEPAGLQYWSSQGLDPSDFAPDQADDEDYWAYWEWAERMSSANDADADGEETPE